VPRIVFASSSTVYGNQESIALTETTPPHPLTVYALTKLTGERLLDMYGRLHGFSHCSLRLFNVYGPRQAPDHPYANVTCKFSHAAANGLAVDLYGDGEQSRDFVYVADVVRAFMAVLERSAHAIYNVGTGETARINDLITALGDIGGRPLEVRRQAPWPNDIRSIKADTGRFAAEFGFRPKVPLSEGLARTVGFFREQANVDA
jgi:UDP-glucose 4-epimerase